MLMEFTGLFFSPQILAATAPRKRLLLSLLTLLQSRGSRLWPISPSQEMSLLLIWYLGLISGSFTMYFPGGCSHDPSPNFLFYPQEALWLGAGDRFPRNTARRSQRFKPLLNPSTRTAKAWADRRR